MGVQRMCVDRDIWEKQLYPPLSFPQAPSLEGLPCYLKRVLDSGPHGTIFGGTVRWLSSVPRVNAAAVRHHFVDAIGLHAFSHASRVLLDLQLLQPVGRPVSSIRLYMQRQHIIVILMIGECDRHLLVAVVVVMTRAKSPSHERTKQ